MCKVLKFLYWFTCMNFLMICHVESRGNIIISDFLENLSFFWTKWRITSFLFFIKTLCAYFSRITSGYEFVKKNLGGSESENPKVLNSLIQKLFKIQTKKTYLKPLTLTLSVPGGSNLLNCFCWFYEHICTLRKAWQTNKHTWIVGS
jgi:hypothetical protein